MKFRYVNEVSEPVRTYQGLMVKTGDVVDLNEHFSRKAMKSPHWKRTTGRKPRGANVDAD